MRTRDDLGQHDDARATEHPSPPGNGDPRALAASLEPVLLSVCEGRLRDVSWFRTDWQRGGAATAHATFNDGRGDRRAVVKLPVGDREFTWIRRLQPPNDHGNGRGEIDDAVVPRLFAAWDRLNGYDLAWIVIECLPHGPLGTKWHDGHVDRIADAAARFHAAAAAFPVDRAPREEEWDTLVRESRETLRTNRLDGQQRWQKALKTISRRLDGFVSEWSSRPISWVHGDLHFANAMSRVDGEDGPVTLIDLAEVRPGHWVEDAVYLERQMWARPERLKACKPVRAVAQARKAHGLPVEEEYPRLADVRRTLLAATAPRFIKSEGDPRHLAACLERLEQAVDRLKD